MVVTNNIDTASLGGIVNQQTRGDWEVKKPRELQPAPDDFKQMAYKIVELEENLDAMRKAADYWNEMYESKCRGSK